MCSRRLESGKRRLFAPVVVAALLLNGAAAAPAGTPNPETRTVVIDALVFAPVSLTVKAGDTVVWANKDPFPHTATSKAGRFDSGEIAAGGSWKIVAKRKGEFSYVCSLHPTMKGTMRVE